MSIITISRQIDSLGDEIAFSLAQKLGWALIDRKRLLDRFIGNLADAHEKHMMEESAKFYLKPSSNGKPFIECIDDALHDYTQTRSAVLVGFGSQMLFSGEADALHIRIIAPRKSRAARIKKKYHVSADEADRILTAADRKRKRFVQAVYGADIDETDFYDMTMSMTSISIDQAVSAIISMQKQREIELQMHRRTQGTAIVNSTAEVPVMKHPAEVEFAKLLDMYHIDWKYEPKTFPIEWDAEGNVTSAFSPDFYLTKFDTYIELTTMNQKYVTAKNKKVRKLKKLYPGTNVKIVYKKDFHSLVERFNLGKGERG